MHRRNKDLSQSLDPPVLSAGACQGRPVTRSPGSGIRASISSPEKRGPISWDFPEH